MEFLKNYEMSIENPFNRIPEDIIIYILDKIADAKSLCICSLVSKQICSLVLQTKIVSIEISSWLPVCSCHRNQAAKPLFQSLLRIIGKPVNSLCRLLKQPFTTDDADMIPNYIPIFKFLLDFSCIDSLTLNMGFSNQTTFEPLVKWKGDKSGFILICAKGVCLNSSENDNDVLPVAPPSTSQLLSLITYHLTDAIRRVEILKPIFSKFSKLKNVLILDSLNQGRVILDEDDIADMMMDEKGSLMKDDDAKFSVKLWHENVLHLPLSRRVMKEVTVFMFKRIDPNDDDCLMMSENVFEEKEYCEVGVVMVKKQAIFEDVFTRSQLLADHVKQE